MEVERPKYQVTTMRVPSRSGESQRFSDSLQGAELPPERGIGSVASRHIETILVEETALDEAMSRSLRGETMDQREMLELQATVYSYSQRVDVATRVIDRGAAALKQLLNTQL
ncbi:MAG: hypothetical protein ACJAYU_002896 [Bradymonadia bacterium]|jgi:hypothetical protein